MQINIQKLEAAVTGILALAILGFSLYLCYVVFFTGPVPETSPSLATINVGAFGGFPKIQKVAEAVSGSADKFALKKKNYIFVDGVIYKSFVNDPIDVPLSEKRGRPDPFVPYAAP